MNGFPKDYKNNYGGGFSQPTFQQTNTRFSTGGRCPLRKIGTGLRELKKEVEGVARFANDHGHDPVTKTLMFVGGGIMCGAMHIKSAIDKQFPVHPRDEWGWRHG